jgi:hypothetical protein
MRKDWNRTPFGCPFPGLINQYVTHMFYFIDHTQDTFECLGDVVNLSFRLFSREAPLVRRQSVEQRLPSLQ